MPPEKRNGFVVMALLAGFLVAALLNSRLDTITDHTNGVRDMADEAQVAAEEASDLAEEAKVAADMAQSAVEDARSASSYAY